MIKLCYKNLIRNYLNRQIVLPLLKINMCFEMLSTCLQHQDELRSWVPKEGEITGKDNLLFSYMDFGDKATGG